MANSSPTAEQRSRASADELEAELNGEHADGDDVARLQEEVLRLRDALIGKDAELGTALGRIAELEAFIQRYESMRAHMDDVLTSRSWRVGRLATLPIRWFKARRP